MPAALMIGHHFEGGHQPAVITHHPVPFRFKIESYDSPRRRTPNYTSMLLGEFHISLNRVRYTPYASHCSSARIEHFRF
jgi:hypothetical protein